MNAAENITLPCSIQFMYSFADRDIKDNGKISQDTIDLFKLNGVEIPLKYVSYL